MTKVLLTGASGYIGKHITLQLLNAGFEVRASVRNGGKADEVRAAMAAHLPAGFDLASKLSFVELDLESDSGYSACLKTESNELSGVFQSSERTNLRASSAP